MTSGPAMLVRRWFRAGLAWAGATWLATLASGGEIASNFTLTNIKTGQPMRLYDFAGSVVLLEFFLPSCSSCRNAAADIEANVGAYYAASGGNPDGVPVTVIYVNEGGNPQAFIEALGLDLVGDDDIYRSVYVRLGGTGTVPYFVVINGVTNATTHQPWEILHRRTGYSTNTTVPDLRAYLDSVQGTVAPRWAEARLSVSHGFEASFRAQKGRTNVIEATSNWRDWVILTNLTGSNTVWFRDPITEPALRRFYRVRVQ